MAKVVKSDDVSSVNSSFAASSTAKLNSANGTFNAKLDKVADDLDQVKLYQQRLLQRYRADMSNVASITAADESSNVIVKELETSSASSSFKTEPKSSKPLTLPRYSPVVLDSMNTTRDAEPLQSEATATVTHESLIRMEHELMAESERLERNREDLIRLRQLAEVADQTTVESIEGKKLN